MVCVPRWIIRHPDLKPSEKVFWAILRSEYADRRTSPTRAELAGDLHLSMDSVDRYFQSLSRVGALRVVTNTGDRAEERGAREIQVVETEDSRKVAAMSAAELRPSQRITALVEVEPNRRFLRKTPKGDVSSTVVSTVKYVRFREFWALYPRKLGKNNAQSWWLKKRVEADAEFYGTILAGLKRWLAVWEGDGRLHDPSKKHIPYPQTWLNRKDYLDDPEPVLQAVSKQTQGMIAASHRFLKRHG